MAVVPVAAMTTPHYVVGMVLPLALSLLPVEMDTPQARAMLVAIGLQESRFRHRQQIGGPARGFWQFERNGVTGVLRHQASRPHAERLLSTLGYPIDAAMLHEAMAHNDILACAFARLLLWTDSRQLPMQLRPNAAWEIYLDTWRPGKPKPDTWPDHFAAAWGQEWRGQVEA